MEKAAKFSFEDLEPVLEHHRGNAMFAEALQEAGSPEDLVLLLGRYIQFNSVFGGAVANLAGAVAVRHDLFRDPQDPVAALADRSAEIASTIFYAAIDEFGDPTKVHRVTHRTMAQATLRAAAQCLGYSSAALNGMLQPDAAVQESVAGVLRGYGVGRVMDGRQILRAIGFHIGSELLADQEFCILDQFLRTRYAELVARLEATAVPVGDARVCAYTWVACHTTVEAEHRDAGFAGANRALRFATGFAPQTVLKGCLVEGVAEFSRVQTGFMNGLLAAGSMGGSLGLADAVAV
ncbi:MAG: hypothetical protein ACLP59_35405 [Bryobacteraceae bacterium]